MRLLHLPLRAIVACLLLRGLEFGELGARRDERLVETSARLRAFHGTGFDHGASLFCTGNPLGETLELGRGLTEFAVEIRDPADQVLTRRNRLTLGLAQPFRSLLRVGNLHLGGSKVPGRGITASVCTTKGRHRDVEVAGERLELGAPSNRT